MSLALVALTATLLCLTADVAAEPGVGVDQEPQEGVDETVGEPYSPGSAAIVVDAAWFAEHGKRNSQLLLFFYAPWCDICQNVARECRAVAAALQANGVPTTVGFVDGSDEQRGQALADEFGIGAFPTLKLFHYGRINHDVTIPRDRRGMYSLLALLSRPASIELTSKAELDETLARWNSRMSVVVGYVERESEAQRHFNMVAENFRGRAPFFHIADPKLAWQLAPGKQVPTMTIHKRRFTTDGEPLAADTAVLEKKAKKEAKRREKAAKRDWTNPDFGGAGSGGPGSAFGFKVAREDQIVTPPVSGTPASGEEYLADMGFGYWEDTVVQLHPRFFNDLKVDPARANLGAPECRVDHLSGWLVHHLLPPVNVLTPHNRQQLNLRSKHLVFFFTPLVSRDATAEKRSSLGGTSSYGLSDERDFLLHERRTPLRYFAQRMLRLAAWHPDFTFAFAAVDENMQVFQQFGFSPHAYHNNQSNLVGVLSGEQKFRYPQNEGEFDAAVMEKFMVEIERGTAEPFTASAPEPEGPPTYGEGDVYMVSHRTFNRYVLNDNEHDVLLLIGTPYDVGTSAALEALKKISLAERGNRKLLVAAYDGYRNDPPPHSEWQPRDLPAIYYGAIFQKSKPSVYPHARYSAKSVAEWAVQHAGIELRSEAFLEAKDHEILTSDAEEGSVGGIGDRSQLWRTNNNPIDDGATTRAYDPTLSLPTKGGGAGRNVFKARDPAATPPKSPSAALREQWELEQPAGAKAIAEEKRRNREGRTP